MTRVFEKVADWQRARREQQARGTTHGFVPTMGALHEGHLSLVRRSLKENDATLVSIFVNPTQFDDRDDFEKYPTRLEQDVALLRDEEVDAVLAPSYDDLYRDRYRYKVSENEFSRILCGASRPGHFDGVLTVVLKLLNIAAADRAYFGEKDYQQLQLIKGMAEAFFMPTEIVACPTVREEDGLAMSSRNLRLSPEQRALAPRFAEALRSPSSLPEIRKELESLGFRVDYLEEIANRRFGAVYLGEVRLIDNVVI